ncbi:hypothetical protein [Metaplanococcus flavidus]|uniref:Uncharacterized protein n=1 Tax=Metaplanococcus flavidus TaxID=569883 RepID=A0ABW3LEL6_9BACL
MAFKDKFNKVKDKVTKKGETHLDEHGNEYKEKGTDYVNENKGDWKDRVTGSGDETKENK